MVHATFHYHFVSAIHFSDLFLHDNDNCPFPPPLPIIFFLPAFSQHALSLRCPSKQAKRHIDFTEEQAELTPVSAVNVSVGLLKYQLREMHSLKFMMIKLCYIPQFFK